MAATQASRSVSVSTWKVRSITVVHWSPLITKVYGFGRSTDMIWQPLTVKLFRGCALAAICWSGLTLKPTKVPSSRRTKYRERQFLMCSPKSHSQKSLAKTTPQKPNHQNIKTNKNRSTNNIDRSTITNNSREIKNRRQRKIDEKIVSKLHVEDETKRGEEKRVWKKEHVRSRFAC